MEFEKRCSAGETEYRIQRFISRYVDTEKIPNRILLWNSLKDEIKTVCRPFSQVMTLDFFHGKTLFVYDERDHVLWRASWSEVLQLVSHLEPWEENIDLLLFDESLDWFAAITHEDLLTLCVGTPLV